MKKFLSLALALTLSLTACGGAQDNPVNVAADRENRIEKILETVPTEEPLEIPTKKPVTVESLTVETPEPVVVETPEPVVTPEPVPVPVEAAPVPVVVPEVPVAPIPTVEPVEVPPVYVAPTEYVVDAPEYVEPVTVPVEPVAVPVAPVEPVAPVVESVPFHEPTPPVVAPEPVVTDNWASQYLNAIGLTGATVIMTDDPALNCGGLGGGCALIGGNVMWISPSAHVHVVLHEYAHAVKGIADECGAEEFAWSITNDRQTMSYAHCA